VDNRRRSEAGADRGGQEGRPGLGTEKRRKRQARTPKDSRRQLISWRRVTAALKTGPAFGDGQSKACDGHEHGSKMPLSSRGY
jgi:hypothetical protein